MFCEFRWLLLFGTAEGTELGASHIACAGQLTVAIEGLVRVMAQHRARSLELLVRTVRYCSGSHHLYSFPSCYHITSRIVSFSVVKMESLLVKFHFPPKGLKF